MDNDNALLILMSMKNEEEEEDEDEEGDEEEDEEGDEEELVQKQYTSRAENKNTWINFIYMKRSIEKFQDSEYTSVIHPLIHLLNKVKTQWFTEKNDTYLQKNLIHGHLLANLIKRYIKHLPQIRSLIVLINKGIESTTTTTTTTSTSSTFSTTESPSESSTKKYKRLLGIPLSEFALLNNLSPVQQNKYNKLVTLITTCQFLIDTLCEQKVFEKRNPWYYLSLS